MTIEFTVDHKDEVADDAGITPLIGWVTATVETRPGNYRVRDLGGATPRALKIASRKGYLAADGHMYADDSLAAPFRLVANDPAFNLRELTYRFDFDLTTPGGTPVSIPFCRGPAPSSDTTLRLARLMNDLDQPVIEVRTKGYAEDILDAGVVGIASAKATTQAEGREAIDAASVAQLDATVVNLHLRPDVAAVQWNTFLGTAITSGQATISGTPLTSADEGKIALLLMDSVADEWLMTTIVDVTAGTVTFADVATATKSPVRVRYGFDGTETLNDALAEISANADGPNEVYLGGNYRLTQLVIPANVRLRGVPWETSKASGLAAKHTQTLLAQLPGAEKDFVVFEPDSDTIPWLGLSGFSDFVLWGPEKNVIGMADATIGNGVAFAGPDGTPYSVQDGFQMERVIADNFPGSGFRCYGAVPFYLRDCKAYYNGRFGFELQRASGSSTNALHVENFSGDWNNLGLVGVKSLKAYDTVLITDLKSEGHKAGDETDISLRCGPGYQTNAIVLDACDPLSRVVVNVASHLRVDRADLAPGPGILIKGGFVPQVAFAGVSVRLVGDEIGSTADAVTLKDEVNSVTIPNTIGTGFYPGLLNPNIVDVTRKTLLDFETIASATAHLRIWNNVAGFPPIIEVKDTGAVDTSMVFAPKGAGLVGIGGTTPTVIGGSGSPADSDLTVKGRGTGNLNLQGTNVNITGVVPSIELGHASDTTLSRSAAGVLAVEGVTVPLNSTTSTHTAQAVELGHASDTTLTRSAAGRLAVEGDVLAFATDGIQNDYLTTGESTLPRRLCIAKNLPSTNGNCRFTYFTARKTETVTQLRTLCGSTAAVTPTLCRVGIYSVAGNGDLTLIASIANDTTLWAAINTAYTRTLSAPFSKVRGTRYAVGLLVVGSATAPNFVGSNSATIDSETSIDPRLSGMLTGQTDLPASATAASLTDTAVQSYTVLLP